MKKTLLYVLLICLPFIGMAQEEAPVIKDFFKSVRGLSSFAFNPSLNIATVNVDNEISEVVAINDRMQVIWRTKVKGYAMSSGKFKDRVYVIAATEHSTMKGSNNVYDAYLLDPANGKVLAAKNVYTAEGTNLEVPNFFSAKDGSFLKLITRETYMTRSLKVGVFPIAFFSVNKWDKEFKATKSLTVVEYNENLEPVLKFKPALAGGTLFGIDYNYRGDLFLSWSKGGGAIEVEKFDPTKTVRSGSVSFNFDLRDNYEAKDPESHFKVFPSESNQDVIYYGICHDNSNKDAQLSLAKINFADKTKQIMVEPMTKDILKQLEKSYVVFNKKVNKPDIGYSKDIDINFMAEEAGNLVISMVNYHTRDSQISRGSFYRFYQSPMVNIYDLNLKLKARQLVPTTFTTTSNVNPTSAIYRLVNGKLVVISNDEDGKLYGIIDLANGQWLKQEYLPKKNTSTKSYVDAVMWYGNSFIVPYAELAGSFMIVTMKLDFNLQWNKY